MMHFDKIAEAAWFALITPFHFGMPIFDPVLIVTMTLVMIVVLIESTGMFLALSDITGKKLEPAATWPRGLRTDGLGTIIGGIFNTFPYTSFSQNVGLVGVTGVRSRYVCVAGGADHGRARAAPEDGGPGRGAPAVRARRRGAGDVRHGGGHRHPHPGDGRLQDQPQQPLHRRDLDRLRHDPAGGAALDATDAARLHPLLDSGILLAAISAVLLNLFFNGARTSASDSEYSTPTDLVH